MENVILVYLCSIILGHQNGNIPTVEYNSQLDNLCAVFGTEYVGDLWVKAMKKIHGGE